MSITEKHISKRLRVEALASIDAKCQLLEIWTRKGIPLRERNAQGPALDWFPTSLRTFCAWDASQNAVAVRKQHPALRRNAYQTLVSDANRLQHVKVLLKALASHADSARKRLDPGYAKQEAERQVRIEREKRAGALLGYRRARQQVRELGSSLLSEQRAHKQTLEHLERKIKEQDNEAVELRRQVADLTATLRKTAPIRPVRSGKEAS